jgi:alkaline phosphatase
MRRKKHRKGKDVMRFGEWFFGGAGFIFTVGMLVSGLGTAENEETRPRNIIVMISDGCGYNHIDATNLYHYGKTGVQPYETFPVRYGMATHMAGGGYDSKAVWSDFTRVLDSATDSAAAATAMATGVKTYDGAIGVDENRKRLRNLVEGAEEQGKSTGVVTSAPVSHATPAAFVAHSESRDYFGEILVQMLEVSGVDVIMGCGHPMFDTDGKPRPEPKYKYVGNEEIWNGLQGDLFGLNTDADHNGKLDDAWTLIEERGAFLALAVGATPKRVVGVAKVYNTPQCNRSGDVDAAPFKVPMNQTVPSLADMVKGALNVLDNDPDGFFLMVEGGAVDWTSHKNRLGRMIEEETDFNNSVVTVLDWATEKDALDETLIIVTGDHECGYLTRAYTGAGDIPWAYEAPVIRGPGQMPDMAWNSDEHTNSLIPFFAHGPMSERFHEHVIGKDPHRGEYIDNTSVAAVIFEALGVEMSKAGDSG